MNTCLSGKLPLLGVLLGLAATAPASLASRSPCLLAQAAPPAPAASAPGADAQPENRETSARPAARRRGVGVVISMRMA